MIGIQAWVEFLGLDWVHFLTPIISGVEAPSAGADIYFTIPSVVTVRF